MLERLAPATEYSLHVVAVYLGKYKLFSDRVQFISPTDNESRRFKENTYRPIHRYPDERRELQVGLAQARGEELTIVTIAVAFWVATIYVFFNKWGKIRMLEPYQPAYRDSHTASASASFVAAASGVGVGVVGPSQVTPHHLLPGDTIGTTSIPAPVPAATSHLGSLASAKGIYCGATTGDPLIQATVQQQQQQQSKNSICSLGGGLISLNGSLGKLGHATGTSSTAALAGTTSPLSVTQQHQLVSAAVVAAAEMQQQQQLHAGSQDQISLQQQQQQHRKSSKSLLLLGSKRYETVCGGGGVGSDELSGGHHHHSSSAAALRRTDAELNYLFQSKAQALAKATSLWSRHQQHLRQQQFRSRLAGTGSHQQQSSMIGAGAVAGAGSRLATSIGQQQQQYHHHSAQTFNAAASSDLELLAAVQGRGAVAAARWLRQRAGGGQSGSAATNATGCPISGGGQTRLSLSAQTTIESRYQIGSRVSNETTTTTTSGNFETIKQEDSSAPAAASQPKPTGAGLRKRGGGGAQKLCQRAESSIGFDSSSSFIGNAAAAAAGRNTQLLRYHRQSHALDYTSPNYFATKTKVATAAATAFARSLDRPTTTTAFDRFDHHRNSQSPISLRGISNHMEDSDTTSWQVTNQPTTTTTTSNLGQTQQPEQQLHLRPSPSNSSNKLKRLLFMSKTHQHHHIATSTSSSTLLQANAAAAAATDHQPSNQQQGQSTRINTSISLDAGCQDTSGHFGGVGIQSRGGGQIALTKQIGATPTVDLRLAAVTSTAAMSGSTGGDLSGATSSSQLHCMASVSSTSLPSNIVQAGGEREGEGGGEKEEAEEKEKEKEETNLLPAQVSASLESIEHQKVASASSAGQLVPAGISPNQQQQQQSTSTKLTQSTSGQATIEHSTHILIEPPSPPSRKRQEELLSSESGSESSPQEDAAAAAAADADVDVDGGEETIEVKRQEQKEEEDEENMDEATSLLLCELSGSSNRRVSMDHHHNHHHHHQQRQQLQFRRGSAGASIGPPQIGQFADRLLTQQQVEQVNNKSQQQMPLLVATPPPSRQQQQRVCFKHPSDEVCRERACLIWRKSASTGADGRHHQQAPIVPGSGTAAGFGSSQAAMEAASAQQRPRYLSAETVAQRHRRQLLLLGHHHHQQQQQQPTHLVGGNSSDASSQEQQPDICLEVAASDDDTSDNEIDAFTKLARYQNQVRLWRQQMASGGASQTISDATTSSPTTCSNARHSCQLCLQCLNCLAAEHQNQQLLQAGLAGCLCSLGSNEYYSSPFIGERAQSALSSSHYHRQQQQRPIQTHTTTESSCELDQQQPGEDDNTAAAATTTTTTTTASADGQRPRISSVFVASPYSRAHRDSFAMLRALSQKKSKSAEDVAYLSSLVLQIWVKERNPLLQSVSQQQLSNDNNNNNNSQQQQQQHRRQSSGQQQGGRTRQRPKSSLTVAHL